MTILAQYLSREGITQTAFAKRVGVSRSYLSEIAGGEKTPGLETAVAIERETKGAVPVASFVPHLRSRARSAA